MRPEILGLVTPSQNHRIMTSLVSLSNFFYHLSAWRCYSWSCRPRGHAIHQRHVYGRGLNPHRVCTIKLLVGRLCQDLLGVFCCHACSVSICYDCDLSCYDCSSSCYDCDSLRLLLVLLLATIVTCLATWDQQTVKVALRTPVCVHVCVCVYVPLRAAT